MPRGVGTWSVAGALRGALADERDAGERGGDARWRHELARRCDSLGRVAAAARSGRRDRRLACRAASRSRRRSHRPRSRRCPDRRRHDPRRDHADDRPLSRTRVPIRSPTTSRRSTGSSSWLRASRTRATRMRSSTPPARAREIRAHHTERLDATIAALDGDPRTAYDVSHVLFAQALSPAERRFALAESLAHLERLVGSGAALRADGGYVRA